MCLRNLFIIFIFTLSYIIEGYSQKTFFVENKGQVINQNNVSNKDVLYTLSTLNYNVSFYKTHFSYEMFTKQNNGIKVDRIEIWLKNTSSKLNVITNKVIKGRHNFYNTNTSLENVPEYEKIIYKNVWEGVDIEFFVNSGKLKYNYIIDVNAKNYFNIEIKGANPKIIDKKIIYTKNGKNVLTEDFPICYWEGENNKTILESLEIKYENGLLKLSYPQIRTKRLIIDPIAYSEEITSYYGGIQQDFAEDIVINSNKEIIMVGYSLSINNIATSGAYQQFLNNVDSYIVKFDSLGTRLWGTYFGGNDFDRSHSLTIDSYDNIIISGGTMSNTGISTAGAYQTSLQGTDDIFIAKFTNNGTLVWSTYFGGNDHDFVNSITTDNDNNIYFTGHTSSSDYPITSDAHLSLFYNSEVAYFTKLSPNGQLLHSSFFGNGEGKGNSIKINNNSIYVSGATKATNGISYYNSHQNNIGGYWDGFLIKFNKDNFSPIFGTYYGGESDDVIKNMCINKDKIYLVGHTSSVSGVSTNNSFQQVKSNYEDGMIIAFDTLGNNIRSTYFGGNGVDYINDIDIYNNNLWIVGSTNSDDLPTDSSSFQREIKGGYDIIISKLDTNGINNFLTYKGGNANDYAKAIKIQDSSIFYYCGNTGSNINFSTNNAHQIYHGGNANDGFISKICKPIYPTHLSENLDTISICMGDSISISSVNNFSNYLWNNGSTSANITIKETGSYFLKTIDSKGCPGKSDTITVIVHKDTINIDYASLIICEEDSTLLKIDTTYTSYTWNNNNYTNQQYVTDTGDYYCYVQDDNGCVFYSDTINLQKSNQYYNINTLGSNVICSGNEVILYINSSNLNSYNWSNNAQTPSVNVSQPGNYWITGFNIYNCPIYSDTIEVIVSNFQNQNVSLNLTDSIKICKGDSVNVYTNEVFSSYEWQDGNTNSNVYVLEEGSVYVSVIDTNGCTSRSDTIVITHFNQAEITVNYNDSLNICEGDSIIIQVINNLSNITWNNNTQNNSQWVKTEGNYYYSAIDTNNCNVYSDTIKLNIYPKLYPLVNVLENLKFCNNTHTTISSEYSDVIWNNNSTSNNLTVYNNGNYFYTVTDTNNCSWNSDTLNIEFIEPKKSNIEINTDKYCIGNNIILKQKNETNYSLISWNGKNTNEYSFYLDSSKFIYVELIDTNHCRTKDSIFIDAKKCINNVLIYPNPVKNKLNINSPKPISSYKIYNNIGEIIKEEYNINRNEFYIVITEFSAGIYVLELNINTDKQAYKFEVYNN